MSNMQKKTSKEKKRKNSQKSESIKTSEMDADKKRKHEGNSSGITPEEKIQRKLSIKDTDNAETTSEKGERKKNGDGGRVEYKEETDMDTDTETKQETMNNAQPLDGMEKKIDSLVEGLNAMRTTVNKIEGVVESISFLSGEIEEIRKEMAIVRNMNRDQKQLEDEMRTIKERNRMLEQRLDDMDNQSRKANIEIVGLIEAEREDLVEKCRTLFTGKMEIREELVIEEVYRVGRRMPGKNRPIIVRLKDETQRMRGLKRRRALKGTQIYLNEDLCKNSRKRKTDLIPIVKELRKNDPKTHMRGDAICTGGRVYRNSRDLPIDTHEVVTRSKDDVTIFRGGYSKLSNGYRVNIRVDGKEWTSVEQYVNFQRAITAGRPDIATRVRATDDPQETTDMTRDLCRDKPQWKERMQTAMEAAMKEKFKENSCKQALKKAGRFIGEITYDKIMGIGMLKEGQWFNQKEWAGESVVGKTLSKIKREIN